MYYIVDYDAFWRYPEVIYSFGKAKNIFRKFLPDHKNLIIEFYDKNYRRRIVWPKGRKR